MRRLLAALAVASFVLAGSVTRLNAEDTAKFAAMVQAGVSRTDTPTRDLTSVIVRLDIETRHVDVGRGWDFALAFDAARQPLFAMVKTASAAAMLSSLGGFATHGGFRIGRATTTTETAIVGRIGAARLDPTDTHPASNDIGAWAAVFDGEVDFRWYSRDTQLAHRDATTLAPAVDVHAGLRHDQRFHRAGDLADFRDPTGRVVAGANVYPIRIVRLTLGAGIAFEGALPGVDRLPSGFNVALAGRLDFRQRREPP